MQRLAIVTLLGLGLATLSFQLIPGATSPPQPLPTAGAAPAAPDPSEARPAEPAPTHPAREKVLAHLQSHHTGLSRGEVHKLASTVIEESERHSVDPELILAVMKVESSYYHMAISPVGALGLMQILPSTGEELARNSGLEWRGPQTLFDPIVNVKLGVAYLKQLSDRYDSMPTALAAYNWGPGRIDRRLRRGSRIPSLYIKQVMKAYESVSVPESGGSS
jgi:hypothetical protein